MGDRARVELVHHAAGAGRAGVQAGDGVVRDVEHPGLPVDGQAAVDRSYEDYEFLYEQAWKPRELENALEQSEVERLYAGRLEDSRWSEGVELQQAAMAALEDRLAGAQNRAAISSRA